MQPNEETTTILVSTQDKHRLDRRKLHSREPYREVLKRVLDEVDGYEEGGQTKPNSEIQKRADRIEDMLNKIVKGRLVKWSTSKRSHEKILFGEVTKND